MMKCDLCGKQGQIQKFSRKDLRKRKTWFEEKVVDSIKKTFKRTEDTGEWLHDSFKKFDNIKNRKIRLCKDCMKKEGAT